MPRPRQYAITSSTPRATLGAVGGRRDRDDAGQRRSKARRPAERENRAEQRRACQRRHLPGREPGLPLQRRDQADEHQPHDDRQHPADALQQKLIGDQRRRHPEHRHRAEHEHGGEPGDEKRRRARLPATARSEPRPRPCVVVCADDRRQIRQVSGHERHHARRRERHQPGKDADPHRDEQRSGGGDVGETGHCAPGFVGCSAASRCTTGIRSPASSSRRNTAATRCWRSSTRVDGITVVGNLPPNAIMVRIAGS